MNITELEATVRASWDREALEIYADHLQEVGDPRGELVAIDLKMDGEPDATVIARRNELITEWFGADVPPGTVKYGFVDVDATGADSERQLVGALQGPGAAYVRSVKLAGTSKDNRSALAMLAASAHPWMTTLWVSQWEEKPTPPIDQAATKQLFEHMPALVSLELAGRRVLGDAVHPNVKRLKISGFDATRAVNRKWPKVESIDFAFHCQFAATHVDPTVKEIEPLLEHLPALKTLDLSRNEPGHFEPRSLGGAIVVSAFFSRFKDHATLATVALPSLPTEPAVSSVERTLASLPALRDVAIYAPNVRLPHHPTATIREIPIPATPSRPKRLG